MDVIRKLRWHVRRELQARGVVVKRVKCGHAGTLDPLATGVLVCGLGRATKQLSGPEAAVKHYTADVALDAFTTTDDAEGELLKVDVARPPVFQSIEAALARLTGEIDQRVPAYSAVHIDGRRAYQLARAGVEVDMPVKRVRVDAMTITAYDWPRLTLQVICGKGVYVRALARDLGGLLGTGGHLTALRRTRVGRFTLEGALTFDSNGDPWTPRGSVLQALEPLDPSTC